MKPFCLFLGIALVISAAIVAVAFLPPASAYDVAGAKIDWASPLLEGKKESELGPMPKTEDFYIISYKADWVVGLAAAITLFGAGVGLILQSLIARQARP